MADKIFPLTLPQQDIFYEQMLYPGLPTHTIGARIPILGEMDTVVFRKAFQQLISQHDTFHGIVDLHAPEPCFRVLEIYDLPLEMLDFSLQDDPIVATDEFINKEFLNPFNLHSGELLNRFYLIRVQPGQYCLFSKYHHIITDGWGTSLMFQRLTEIYNALIVNEKTPEYTFSYLHFAENDIQYRQSGSYIADSNYWKQKFATLPEVLLPAIGLDAHTVTTPKSGHHEIYIPRDLYNRIITLATREHVSVFHVMLAVLYAYYGRMCNNTDFAIGIPVLNRGTAVFKKTVGLFTGIIPLRISFDLTQSFTALLKSIRDELRNCYRHQRYPLGKMVGDLKLNQQQVQQLFNITLSYEKHDYSDSFSNTITEVIPLSHQHERVALAIYIREFDDTRDVKIDFDYNIKYYDDSIIQQLALHFENLVQAAVEKPALALLDLDFMSVEEKNRLFFSFNNTNHTYDNTATFLTLFNEVAVKHPGCTAVVCGNRAFTYQAINEMSDRVAALLQQRMSNDNKVIGLITDRSEYRIIGMLGIMKAGAIYLPVDETMPPERIQYSFKTTGARILLTNLPASANVARDIEIIPLSDCIDCHDQLLYGIQQIQQDDLAYIMFTSGSTGRPKGVEITHRALYNFITSMMQRPGFTRTDKLLAVTTFTFDISLLELLLPLCCGGTVVLAGRDEVVDPSRLIRLLSTHRPTIMQATPSLWKMLTDSGWQGDRLLRVLSGGEQILYRTGLALLQTCRELWNMYGPTETTIWSAIKQIRNEKDLQVVGEPINNTRIYITDENGNPAPAGAIGEVLIAGDGLARGYCNNTLATEEKFINSADFPDNRLYKTGDLGRWLSNGDLAIIGRSDNQIKLRGYRIELGDIENALNSHPGIKQAVVIAKEHSPADKYLVAFILAEENIDKREINLFLQNKLPEYMVPHRYITLEEIPLNSSGKVNRKALAAMDLPVEVDSHIEKSDNPAESILIGIWNELFHREDISVNDDFFALGGHSLKVTELINRVRNKTGCLLQFPDIFNYPTIAQLAQYMGDTVENDLHIIPVLSSQTNYKLSPSQQSIWVLSQIEEASIAYNITVAFDITGDINKNAIQLAFSKIIERHESLRTSFVSLGEEVVQEILPVEKIGSIISIVIPDQLQDPVTEAYRLIKKDSLEPFDLSEGPLLKIWLLELAPEKFILYLKVHHIIADGVSMEIMAKEFEALYNFYSGGGKVDLMDLPIQFRDYADWLNTKLNTGQLKDAEQHWMSVFKNGVPVTELPVDYPRLPAKTYNGKKISFELPGASVTQLEHFSARNNATVFMSLLAALDILIYKYTGQHDILIGTPVACRTNDQVQQLIGNFINLIPLKMKVEGNDSVSSLLARIREMVIMGYAHQEYPFDLLLEKLQAPRDPSRSPLFDILVVFQEGELITKRVFEAGGARFSYLDVVEVNSKFDLTFYFYHTEQQVLLNIEYNTSLFHNETIEQLARHFINIVNELIGAASSKSIDEISCLTPNEKESLLVDCMSQVESSLPFNSLHQLVMNQAGRTPDQIALVFGEHHISYAEIMERSDRVAVYLRNRGCNSGGLIGILMNRSPELVIAILGILKTGCAYVPIDPVYPSERKRIIIADSNISFLITDNPAEYNEIANECTCLAFGEIEQGEVNADIPENEETGHIAYVIYTSGSTGRPKGVLVTHQNALTLLAWAQEEFLNTRHSIVYAATSICFDLSVFELFYGLGAGKKIRLLASGLEMSGWMEKDRDILLNTVPSFAVQLFLSGASFENVTALNVAGEPVPTVFSSHFDPTKIEIRNLYGPTEATVYSLRYLMKKEDQVLPAGKPIAGSIMYVQSPSGSLQPVGVEGELYISGGLVSNGYLNDPEKTAMKFMPDPFREHQLMYRTGDVMVKNRAGDLVFKRRIDNQVKVNGYRIELEEIQTHLQQQPEIREAAVVIRRTGTEEPYLCAYYVAEQAVDSGQLQDRLHHLLPAYMVPAYFIQVPELPLSVNGKLDTRFLPAPVMQQSGQVTMNDAEKTMLAIWCEVLGIGEQQINIAPDFFRLGGNSLKAVKLLSVLRNRHNISAGLADIFRYSSLLKMSRLLTSRQHDSVLQIPKAAIQEYYPLSHAQKRLFVLYNLNRESLVYNIPLMATIKGKLDPDRLKECFTTIISRHEVFRTRFTMVQGVPCQQVVEPVELQWLLYGQEASVDDAINNFVRVFDLENGPLLRVGLKELGPDRCMLMIDVHHIVADGDSVDLLIKEVVRSYKGDTLAPVNYQYKDFVVWEHSPVYQHMLEKQKYFWLNELKGEIPVLELPTDKPRPQRLAFSGHTYAIAATPEMRKTISALCKQEEVTLFTFFFTIFNILLSGISKETDIITGVPVRGRAHSDLDNVMGMFVNTLPVRTICNWELPFTSFLQQVKDHFTSIWEYQEYPYERMINDIQLLRDPARNPLFDVLFVYAEQHEKDWQLSGIEVTHYPYYPAISKFDLFLTVRNLDEEIVFEWQYNTDLFEGSTIHQFVNWFNDILQVVVQDTKVSIGDALIFTKEEHFSQADRQNRLALLNGLSQPAGQNMSRRDGAPASENEQVLATEVALLLGRPSLNMNDDFFRSGGDSIKAIQLQARLREKGYDINSIDILRFPRLRELAGSITKTIKHVSQTEITGAARFSIAQERFFRTTFIEPHHYNQSIILILHKRFDRKVIEDVFTTIQEHHDALRMKFQDTGSGKTPWYSGRSMPVWIREYDLSDKQDENDMLNAVNEVQQSINLETGPLMHIGWLRMPTEDRLLITIHHLVVDGLSWRILLEDINTLISQVENNQPLLLPLRTNSFQEWTASLWANAEKAFSEQELNYWKTLEAKNTSLLKHDKGTIAAPSKVFHKRVFNISKENTLKLTGDAHRAYNTETQDLILAAIGMALQTVFDTREVKLLLEWHGRDTIGSHLDVSRTVGWFTNFCPLLLNLQYTDDISRHIIETKDGVHGIRQRRMNYGILKYLSRSLYDDEVENAGIIFNYWGQFSGELESPYFTVSNENAGDLNNPEQLQNYEMEFNGWIVNGSLQLTIVYNRERLSGELINELQNHIEQAVYKIINHCLAVPLPLITSSDVLYPALPYAQLQQLLITYKKQIQDIYPLTPVQQGIFFHHLQHYSAGLYHEQIAFTIAWRNLKAERLQACLAALMHSHDVLRAVYVHDKGMPPMQVIFTEQAAAFEFLDISSRENKDRFIAEYKEQDRQKGFDLQQGPLLRLSVLHIGNSRYELIWSFHHIIMDGWCISRLMDEFLGHYVTEQHDISVAKDRYPYRNYISWLSGSSQTAANAYWSSYVSDYTTTTGLPLSQSVAHVYKGGRLDVMLQEAECRSLQEYASHVGITLNTLLQALWGILLSRYNNNKDVIFGSVVSGRNAGVQGIEDMVGLFINTIPVRVKYKEGSRLAELCRNLQQQSMESMEHHHYPLYEIQSASVLKNKLFDHIIAFENYPLSERFKSLEGEDISIENIDIHERTNYAFNLVIQPQEDLLCLRAIFDANRYAEWLVKEVLDHFRNLIKQVQVGKDVLIEEMEIQDKPDAVHLAYNQEEDEVVLDVDLWRQFEAIASLHPDRIALIAGNNHLSYEVLRNSALKVGALLQQAGVTGGSVVALKIDRSAEMVISVLGILASGAAYLPLELQWPHDRQRYALKQSGVKTGISSRGMEGQLPADVQWLYIEDLLQDNTNATVHEGQRSGGRLAYIIFTSGSTGQPKGIAVSQGSVWRLANNRIAVEVTASDTVLQWSNYAFDGSVFDIFCSLLKGGRLVMMELDEAGMLRKVLEKVARQGVDVFFITAAMFHAIVDEGAEALKQLKNARKILVGGAKLSYQHIKRAVEVLGPGVLVNGYGPTETTVFSTFYEINQVDEVLGSIPIGKPLSYTRVRILEEGGDKILPCGVWGEVCIGGSRLSDGYVGDKDLTATKFVADPYIKGSILYRTGDIGRWLPDGNIEYLSRKDDQVKVRGYRIELGEIEQEMMAVSGIQQCHVIVKKETLCAYYKSIQQFAAGMLREQLSERLPAYMIPSLFIRVDEFPLTANGKLNIAALPQSDETHSEELIVNASTETEKQLTEIWLSVLELADSTLSVNKNFFEIGGHSIRATQLIGKVRECFFVELSLKQIMAHATIKKQAAVIDSMVKHMEKMKEILEKIENS